MPSPKETNGRTKTSHWLDLAETLAVVSSIGGTVAAVVSQQIAMVMIPLSLTATINLANRRRQTGKMLEQQRVEVSLLIQQNTDSMRNELSEAQQNNEQLQLKLDELHEQDTQASEALQGLTTRTTQMGEEISSLNQLQDQNHSSLAALSEQQRSAVTQFDDLSSKMEDLHNAIALLQSTTLDLSNQVETQQNQSQFIAAQTKGVQELLETLRAIDTLTQAISDEPNVAESFYQRGVIRKRLQRNEDQETVMNDFSRAIQLKPSYAEAYFERGIMASELGQKQRAVDDLHVAAKLFFEAGQLDQYEKAREVSLNLHDLVSETMSNEESDDPMLVENLFG